MTLFIIEKGMKTNYMKKLILPFVLMIALIGTSFKEAPNKLVGRWEWKRNFKDGPMAVLLIYRADSTCDVFINGKSLSRGKYFMNGDTLNQSDPICNSDYYGKYLLTFYEQDSVRFNVISDTCTPRREGTDTTTYVKVKPKK